MHLVFLLKLGLQQKRTNDHSLLTVTSRFRSVNTAIASIGPLVRYEALWLKAIKASGIVPGQRLMAADSR